MIVDASLPAVSTFQHCTADKYPCTAESASNFTCGAKPYCFSFTWSPIVVGPSGVANVSLIVTLKNTTASALVLLRVNVTDFTINQV